MDTPTGPITVRAEHGTDNLSIVLLVQSRNFGQSKRTTISIAAILNRAPQSAVLQVKLARLPCARSINQDRVRRMGSPRAKQIFRTEQRQAVHPTAQFVSNRCKHPPLAFELNKARVACVDVFDEIAIADPARRKRIGAIKRNFARLRALRNHPNLSAMLKEIRI